MSELAAAHEVDMEHIFRDFLVTECGMFGFVAFFQAVAEPGERWPFPIMAWANRGAVSMRSPSSPGLRHRPGVVLG